MLFEEHYSETELGWQGINNSRCRGSPAQASGEVQPRTPRQARRCNHQMQPVSVEHRRTAVTTGEERGCMHRLNFRWEAGRSAVQGKVAMAKQWGRGRRRVDLSPAGEAVDSGASTMAGALGDSSQRRGSAGRWSRGQRREVLGGGVGADGEGGASGRGGGGAL